MKIEAQYAFRDVNGDGRLDVVYLWMYGNGWLRQGQRAVSITSDGAARDVEFRPPLAASEAWRPVDVDGDGTLEWLAVDASWELQGFCHACSPRAYFMLAWDARENAYVDASSRFADYLLRDVKELVVPAAGASCQEKDRFLSAAVSVVLSYTNAGTTSGVARVIESIRSMPADGWMAEWRDAIAATLASDPHMPAIWPADGGHGCAA